MVLRNLKSVDVERILKATRHACCSDANIFLLMCVSRAFVFFSNIYEYIGTFEKNKYIINIRIVMKITGKKNHAGTK